MCTICLIPHIDESLDCPHDHSEKLIPLVQQMNARMSASLLLSHLSYPGSKHWIQQTVPFLPLIQDTTHH